MSRKINIPEAKKNFVNNIWYIWYLVNVRKFLQISEYGCSFVAKLSWKKKFFFFGKNICFLQNVHYLQKKLILYGKKVYIDFFLLKKLFWQKTKKIYLIWEIFFYPENIYSFCKKMFLIIKNIFVKASWWTQ